MRILQVTEASGAGTLRIVETLCGGLTGRGHEVVLAHGRRPETPSAIGGGHDGAFQVEELDWDRRTPPGQIRAFTQLRQLVRQVQPDVIHLHSTFAGLVGGSLDDRHPRVYTPTVGPRRPRGTGGCSGPWARSSIATPSSDPTWWAS